MENMELKPRKEASQERSKQTVRAIVEATVQLLNRDNSDTSTNRIAEKAGVSIGSLYQYFPNKEAILKKVIDVEWITHRQRVQDLFDKCKEKDLNEGIELIAEESIDLMNENKKVRRVILQKILQYEFFEQLARTEDILQEMLVDFVKEKTTIRDEQKIKELTFSVIHGTLGILRAGTLFDFRPVSRDELKSMIVHFYHGILREYEAEQSTPTLH